jgi:hypothetical protein
LHFSGTTSRKRFEGNKIPADCLPVCYGSNEADKSFDRKLLPAAVFEHWKRGHFYKTN